MSSTGPVWLWPSVLPDGPKKIIPFAPCHHCGRGTWVCFGTVATCYYCATGEAPPPEMELEGPRDLWPRESAERP